MRVDCSDILAVIFDVIDILMDMTFHIDMSQLDLWNVVDTSMMGNL